MINPTLFCLQKSGSVSNEKNAWNHRQTSLLEVGIQSSLIRLKYYNAQSSFSQASESTGFASRCLYFCTNESSSFCDSYFEDGNGKTENSNNSKWQWQHCWLHFLLISPGKLFSLKKKFFLSLCIVFSLKNCDKT